MKYLFLLVLFCLGSFCCHGQTYSYQVIDDGTESTACRQLTKCQLIEGTATSVADGRQAIINQRKVAL